ncbi:MAG: outer membrane beta-barrel protein [Deltaproteobacteria bacterium]|nr:outer membrane beta-barrel protein [Deltaproteobacteria bacterium]
MKKLLILALALASFIGTAALAEDSYISGGFEASGNIVAGAGWQRFKTKAGNPTVFRDINGNLPGVIGAYDTVGAGGGTTGGINRMDIFKFFVDQAELDLAKSFGENIRIRTDLNFGSNTMNGGNRFATGAGGGAATNVIIEQAYATANMSVGNGLEFLLGRFNAPIGFEKVNVVYNDTISHSVVYRALRPNTFTGAKFYYSFSDAVDWNIYVVNSGLSYDDGDTVTVNSDIPGAGTRLGFNWGEEGKKSTLGFSGVYGQDHTATSGMKKHISFLGDVDWQWWVTDNFAFGGEGAFRQINSQTIGEKNAKYLGLLANLHYNFSDVWDGTLRYAFAKEFNNSVSSSGSLVTPVTAGAVQSLVGGYTAAGAGTSAAGKEDIHEITLAGNYAIADGAKLKLEGGYTLIMPSTQSTTGTGTEKENVFGVAGAFAYEF